MADITALESVGLRRALVADRDGDTRHHYAAALDTLVGTVTFAEDGRDALVQALACPPSLLVTSAHLPIIDGYELIKLLRHDALTNPMLMVMVTHDAVSANLERADRVGADLVVVKPCLPDTLHQAIRRLADRSVALRERSRVARARIPEHIAKSDALIARSRGGRPTLRKAHDRHDTTAPPTAPPPLVCTSCHQPLHYRRSHIGGVTAQNAEQWDYYECATGCGSYQYRHRSRKLRRL
jgi:CheY-like chemotaxis protein